MGNNATDPTNLMTSVTNLFGTILSSPAVVVAASNSTADTTSAVNVATVNQQTTNNQTMIIVIGVIALAFILSGDKL